MKTLEMYIDGIHWILLPKKEFEELKSRCGGFRRISNLSLRPVDRYFKENKPKMRAKSENIASN